MAQLKFNSDGQPHLKLTRNAMNLSNKLMFDASQGDIMPVGMYDCVPGDKFRIGCDALIRTNALIKPAFTNDLNAKVASFRVAYRTLWKDFENFYTGGYKGDKHYNLPFIKIFAKDMVTGSLIDYLGMPVKDNNPVFDDAGFDYFSALPFLAYIKIWNDYFRNPSIDVDIDVYNLTIYNSKGDYIFTGSPIPAEVNIKGTDITIFVRWCLLYISGLLLSSDVPDVDAIPPDVTAKTYNFPCAKVNLPRDMFTSCLPEPISSDVGLPLTGSVSNITDDLFTAGGNIFIRGGDSTGGDFLISQIGGNDALSLKKTQVVNVSNTPVLQSTDTRSGIGVSPTDLNNRFNRNFLDNVSLTTAIYPREMRLLFALDLRSQLRNLAGNRYKDVMYSYYGVTLNDGRLQRAEFIGSKIFNIYTSEVLQTSGTTDVSPLGEQAGHAIASGVGDLGSTFVDEPSIIFNLMWINNYSIYTQNLEPIWRKESLDDFFFSSFENLGDQDLKMENVCYSLGQFKTVDRSVVKVSNINNTIFGYVPRYSEYKYCSDTVRGSFRTNKKYWTQARVFKVSDSTALDFYPALNSSFIKPDATSNNRIFSTLDDNISKPYYIKFANRVLAFRPMQALTIGMNLDHF